MYTKNPTGLPGEEVMMNGDKIDSASTKHYYQRPEAIESWYVLYRITRDPMYREWGWSFFESIEKYTKAPYGYSGLYDATNHNPGQDNIQQTFFLAETLKYLYLLFAPEDLLPLEKYVFNTEAHPFPVIDYPLEFKSKINWKN